MLSKNSFFNWLILFLFFSSSFAFAAKDGLVSVDLQEAELSSVIRMFAEEAGYNLIGSKDLYGKVTIFLKDVPPEKALKEALDASGYSYHIKGNTVYISASLDPPTTLALPGGRISKTVRINYSDPDNVKDTLLQMVPSDTKILTTKGLNAIVIEGTPGSVKRAEFILRTLDVPPKQVMVEARILDISHTTGSNLGVNLKETNPNNPNEIWRTLNLAGDPTAAGAQGLYYSVTNQNIEALVEALQSRAGYNLLSSPRVVAMDGQLAEIIQGSRLGYKTKTVTTTGLIEGVEFLDVGTKLTITPKIKSDGNMIVKIHPEISSGAIVNELPQKDSTETTTELMIRDGQTIIIGGLVKEEATETKKGIPVLCDIPYIGVPFRSTVLSTIKKEIVILISPRILNPESVAQMETTISTFEARFRKTSGSQPASLFR